MLKSKSSKLMSGTSAVALVVSLGSMSTAAENIPNKISLKWVCAGTGLVLGLLSGLAGKEVTDVLFNNDSENKWPARIAHGVACTVCSILGSALCWPIGALAEIFADIERKKKQNSKV